MTPTQEQAQPRVAIADAIDGFIRRSGLCIAWVYVLLVAVIVLQVTLRKGFSSGLIALEELQWHLYAIGVMFGMAYAQVTDSHVRVDLLYSNFRQRTKRIVEVFAIVVFALPFLYVVFDHSLDFVADSWRIDERSSAPSGLPYRWAIKAVMPVSVAYLALAMVSRLIREVVLLKRGE
ncbi:TRAP transporter small permease subunit [Balneatrix alpica]|uniref:TRAP transporter small permease subunit n=1 Tax=Balneatrix alpica TaxID=75684 RepID=UPI0027386DDD|nr:TRAP transporter small permease subunit [Balneatrix alpica]